MPCPESAHSSVPMVSMRGSIKLAGLPYVGHTAVAVLHDTMFAASIQLHLRGAKYITICRYSPSKEEMVQGLESIRGDSRANMDSGTGKAVMFTGLETVFDTTIELVNAGQLTGEEGLNFCILLRCQRIAWQSNSAAHTNLHVCFCKCLSTVGCLLGIQAVANIQLAVPDRYRIQTLENPLPPSLSPHYHHRPSAVRGDVLRGGQAGGVPHLHQQAW